MEPIDGARKIINTGMNIKPGEKLVIITERSTIESAGYFLTAAIEAKAQVSMVAIPNLKYNGEEPSELVSEIMQLADAAVIVVKNSLATTTARQKATSSGVRCFSLAGFTEDMLRKGCIEADFLNVKPSVWAVAEKLSGASKALLTSKKGTRLEMSLEGRFGNALDALAHEPGAFRSMSIEAFTAPVEDTASGVLVVDGAAPIGLVRDDPIKVIIDKGRIVEITGGPSASRLQGLLEEINDSNMYRVAELGIGLNPAAKLSGSNYIEDESAIGTVHVAIGRNISLGGKINAKAHYDLIIDRPDLRLDDEWLMQDGELLF